MAADWPQLADVQALLRVQPGDDDDIISAALAAAIGWVTNRIDPMYVPGSPTYVPPATGGPLADPLFQAALTESGRLYRRRDSVDGTIGWGDMGVVRVGPKDPDIETLLAPYLAIVFS